MNKKLKIFLIIFGIIIIAIAGYFVYSFFLDKTPANTAVLENPLKRIIQENTDANGVVNQQAVIELGISDFNSNYINYILIALGVGNLKSMIGCGNPVVELVLDNEIWSSELKDNALYTQKAPNEQKDLIIKMSKQEAVKAILSENIKEFMKSSVSNGNTGLEMISGKACLLAKGYLEMYEKLK